MIIELTPLGPNVNGFVRELAAYNSIRYSLALSSGTSALHLALILLGVEQDDEVLCSTFTAIAYQKVIPIIHRFRNGNLEYVSYPTSLGHRR
jgi:dTDP-4-amino-4,6-dideoxygalactose transaminase